MLSYCKGPETAILELSVGEAFQETAARFPGNEALIVPHEKALLTFAQLRSEVECVARGLAGLGLCAQDRIGVWSTNCVEWILVHLACARIGAVLVNVNPAYRAYELAFVLRKSGMKALFLWEKDARSNYRAILQEAAGERVALKHVVYFGTDSWSQMLANGVEPAPAAISPDDVTNIQYTSGTTGSPKGVLLTHRNLVNNALVIASGMKITERDRIAVPVPLYHCFGSVAGTLVMVTKGATMILPAPTFDALATMKAIHEERVTTIYGVPTMFIAEMEHAEFGQRDFTSLRTGVMAGAPCPIEVMKRVVNEMHCPEMTIMYGQTESSPVITMSSVDDSLERRVSTVGCACPNTEVKIVSPATGETVPVGEQGELCTRGYLVMKGYDQEAEATKRAIDEEGWLHTGDLATMRPDTYFRVTGRAKDMIIRGGENVYPREVEEFLYTHPKVADVQVLGLPDAKLGEVVAAWIRLKEPVTVEEIQEFCKGKIAHFKIPQFIRFVDAFPMTVTGKIQKFRMREIEIQERGLAAAAGIKTA